MAPPPDRLHAFLYHLMHDHLPPGKVIDIIKRLPDEDEQMLYPSPELHALSYRLALKILPEPEPETDDDSPGAQAWLAAAPERILSELRDERARSGHGFTLEELAQRVGWDVAKEDDVAEAGTIVQALYDRGYVQRDNMQGRILLTSDGVKALEAGVL